MLFAITEHFATRGKLQSYLGMVYFNRKSFATDSFTIIKFILLAYRDREMQSIFAKHKCVCNFPFILLGSCL